MSGESDGSGQVAGTESVTGVPPQEAGELTPAAKERLGSEVRTLRRWLVAQTVLLVAILLAIGAVAYGGRDYLLPPTDAEADLTPVRSEPDAFARVVEDAYGESLESVQVATVTVQVEDPELAGPDADFTYRSVTYRLRGSTVAVTGLVSDVTDLVDFGYLPTQSSLTGLLSDEDLLALMRAWQSVSNAPMGAVLSYPEILSIEGRGEPVPGATMRFAGRRYGVEDLWRVSEGLVAPNGPLTLDATMGRKDRVFHRDPRTGAWTLLSTTLCEDYYPF